MKRLYLIRHAKSSWSEVGQDDFHRPLNHRGKTDGPTMAKRLADAGIRPELIVSSPAVRAKKTARLMAAGTGYEEEAIHYDDKLYLGSLAYHCHVIARWLDRVEVLFLVGHNNTITELAEHLCGHAIGNIPTCGVVALEFVAGDGIADAAGKGRLVFFWTPKDQRAIER